MSRGNLGGGPRPRHRRAAWRRSSGRLHLTIEGPMPFAVFRRHQRKMLAVLAIMAMIAFTMDVALTRSFRGGFQGGSDPVVVELYGRSIRRSEIEQMREQRARANLFIDQLARSPVGLQSFGDLSTRSLVDALILEHEADT